MSDAETGHAATESHDDVHEHASAGEPLGPIDWEVWAYALGGATLGALVALALFIARGG